MMTDTRKTALTELGSALYGGQWQSAVARGLGVSDRTVRRWAAGAIHMPDGAWAELLRVAQERAERIQRLLSQIRSEA